MKKTRRIALLAVMLALIIILSMIPLRISAATLALTLLPVLVVALTQDLFTAFLAGLIMGVTSLVMAYTVGAATPTAPLFQNPLVSILPRVFVPLAAFAVSGALCAVAKKADKTARKGRRVASDRTEEGNGEIGRSETPSKSARWIIDAAASLVAVITNTGLVLGMIWLLYGGKSVGDTLISPEFMTAMISVNFVIEVIVFPLIVPPVVYAVRKQGGAYVPSKRRAKALAEDMPAKSEVSAEESTDQFPPTSDDGE